MLKDESDVGVYKISQKEVTAVWWSCCCLWTQNIIYPHKFRVGVDGKYMAWPPLKVLNSVKIPLLGAPLHLMSCESSFFSTHDGAKHKKIHTSYELLCERLTNGCWIKITHLENKRWQSIKTEDLNLFLRVKKKDRQVGISDSHYTRRMHKCWMFFWCWAAR